MKKIVLLLAAFVTVVASPAEARRGHRHHVAHARVVVADPGCNIIFPCEGVKPSVRGERIVKAMGGFGSAQQHYTPRVRHVGAKGYGRSSAQRSVGSTSASNFGAPSNPIVAAAVSVRDAAVRMLPHPAGCPSRAFCGCGAAVDLGLNPRTHMLAASYFRYPPAAPAPNMVAVRNHHVFVLKQQVASGQWLVADYNSGGHASRLHVRSLRGYSIRNPHV